MSQLANKKTPLELRTELHKMVVADLLGSAGGEDLVLRVNHERWEEEQKSKYEEKKDVSEGQERLL